MLIVGFIIRIYHDAQSSECQTPVLSFITLILGIILSSDLSWADQVNYAVKKAWKALHFKMRILKRVIVIPKV